MVQKGFEKVSIFLTLWTIKNLIKNLNKNLTNLENSEILFTSEAIINFILLMWSTSFFFVLENITDDIQPC